MTVEQKAKRFCKNFVFTYVIPSYNQTKRKSGALIAEESFIAGYNECEKEHEWHDLRKDPNDLPKEEKLGQTFVVAFAFNEQTQQYYSFDCAEYIDRGRFITHTIDGNKENNAYKIIAWKEIVPPKESK